MGRMKHLMMDYWEQNKANLEELEEEIQKIPTIQRTIADLEYEIECIHDNLHELLNQLKQSEITLEEFKSQTEIKTGELESLQEELEEAKAGLDDLQEKALEAEELKKEVEKGPFPTIS